MRKKVGALGVRNIANWQGMFDIEADTWNRWSRKCLPVLVVNI